MSNWSTISKIYLYDNTFYGLLTIIFDSYEKKEIPVDIKPTSTYIAKFIDTTLEIETDFEKATKLVNAINLNISYETLYFAYNAFLSDIENRELDILKYIIHGFKIGSNINNNLKLSYVLNVTKLHKKVTMEACKMRGFLRFSETTSGIYHSIINPSSNILEIIGNHFIKRLPTEKFIIEDSIRNIAFIYDSKKYLITPTNKNHSDNTLPSNIILTDRELEYQNLWKTFHKTVSIKERTNSKLQMQMMPKKYWKHMLEMK